MNKKVAAHGALESLFEDIAKVQSKLSHHGLTSNTITLRKTRTQMENKFYEEWHASCTMTIRCCGQQVVNTND